jgi:hypothetical protein
MGLCKVSFLMGEINGRYFDRIMSVIVSFIPILVFDESFIRVRLE